MTLVALALASAVLLCTILVLALAFRYRDRWGIEVAGHVPAGAGAYRGGAVTEHRHRGLPTLVGVAAGTGFLWALATFLGFAPAGSLFGVVMMDQAPWFSALLLLVCLSGFLLSIGLVVAGVQLLRRQANAGDLARGIAWWSYAHHAAVAIVFMLAILADSDLAVLTFAAIPCLIGAAHAELLRRCATVVDLAPT